MFRIPKLRFAKFSTQIIIKILKPTAIHILCAVGFYFILLSVHLFFLTPPFTHSTIFYCLQTVRHTRTVIRQW